MIEVQGLSKSYRERAAISDVSFSVKKGEILGFLGPNGAGKSTTMKILSGLLLADTGTANVGGFNVREQAREAKSVIGYLPETPPVYLQMEVGDYLEFAAALHRVPRAQRRAAVDLALSRCNLGDVRGRIIGHLSKGFRQRVGLAQAIVHSPPILILDEPTVGLDPKQIIEIRNLVRGFAGKHTVILSTHILSEVKATCDRVVVIDRGKVVAEDTIDGIPARAASEESVTAVVKRDPKGILERLKRIPGVASAAVESAADGEGFRIRLGCERGRDPRPEFAELLVGASLGLVELARTRVSLEDAFVKLVTPEAKKRGGDVP